MGGSSGCFLVDTPAIPTQTTSFGITTSRITMLGIAGFRIATFRIQRDPRYKGVRKFQSGLPDLAHTSDPILT